MSRPRLDGGQSTIRADSEVPAPDTAATATRHVINFHQWQGAGEVLALEPGALRLRARLDGVGPWAEVEVPAVHPLSGLIDEVRTLLTTSP